jgi:predicted nucleotidyltransferase
MKYDSGKREIKSNKVLNELDKFVLSFIKILEKHIDYVIISGYVSLLLGRTRTTEDVDIFIKEIPLEKFLEFYKELRKEGFWCINAERGEEIYSYLREKLGVRFSRENQPVPNFEVKFPKREIDKEIFQDFLTVKLQKGELKISSLERHIAFKRYYLGTEKDKEDAEHIEETFKGLIDYGKVNKFKETINKINEDEKRKIGEEENENK